MMGPLGRRPVTSPQTRETAKITTKKKKQSRAISAAPAPIPPNPKTAAMIAMMKNPSAHRSMNHLVSRKSVASPPKGLLPGAEPVPDQSSQSQPEQGREHGPLMDEALRAK